MKKLKILHTADLHLDSPFQGLSSEKAAVRRSEQRKLLSALAALVRSEAVDMVLISGDLLDSSSAYYETARQLTNSFEEMAVPIFIAPGNHDFYSSASFYARAKLPPNVHVFNNEEISSIEVPELETRVYGAAFTDSICKPLLKDFKAVQDGMLNVMCIHGDALDARSRYDPIQLSDIETSGLDYLALGHIHSASGLHKAGAVFYAWPGCPEGRGFDETGEKTVYLAEIQKGSCELIERSVALRRYDSITVDITDAEPLIALTGAVPEWAEGSICRIILTGETYDAPDVKKLCSALEDMFFELQIIDKTTAVSNLWNRAGEDTLRGIFLRRLKCRFEETTDQTERERIIQAVRWGLAALDNRDEVIRHED